MISTHTSFPNTTDVCVDVALDETVVVTVLDAVVLTEVDADVVAELVTVDV